MISLTILAPGETWGCTRGRLLLSWWCQWSTSRRWCSRGCSDCSLCQNWRGLFSCCSCPGGSIRNIWRQKLGEEFTFRKRSLQLSSSDSSKQLDVWSHLWEGLCFHSNPCSLLMIDCKNYFTNDLCSILITKIWTDKRPFFYIDCNMNMNLPYLIFVIFFTQAKFFEPKFYTQKRVN